jgi:hypothetical protein
MQTNRPSTGGDPAEGANDSVVADDPADATIKTEAEPKHNTDKVARERGMLPIRRPTGA